MIVSLRVDDRLIHGQVALVWSKEFNTDRIVVANDSASVDQIQQMTLKMATPSGIKLLIKNIEDSIRIFNDDRSKQLKLFVLTNTVSDALKIVENCEDIGSVNVANVGRFDKDTNQTVLNSCISLNATELIAFKKLATYDFPVYHQVIPSSNKTKLEKLIEG